MGYLEDHDYLERRPDPTDRRAALVCLTERGWQEIRAALAIITEIERDWEHRLGKERMAVRRDLLTELSHTHRPTQRDCSHCQSL